MRKTRDKEHWAFIENKDVARATCTQSLGRLGRIPPLTVLDGSIGSVRDQTCKSLGGATMAYDHAAAGPQVPSCHSRLATMPAGSVGQR